MSKLIPSEITETRIFLVRENKVMIDSDLAAFYGIPAKRLLEQVRRNIERFPEDFMLQLTKKEAGDAGIFHTPLRNRAAPCSPASSKAKGLST